MNYTFQAINWNRIEDDIDKQVWDRLNANLWLDTKIPLSNDIKSWETLSETDKTLTMRVFAGLTLLDTLQSTIGVGCLIEDAATPHEKAILTQIQYMESVHAKSYSSIFSTLSNTKDINAVFQWVEDNEFLQNKARLVSEQYIGADPLMKKAASVALESLLFYSGFYLPIYWLTRSKLTNTSDIIKLIIADEAIHGYYIGYKFQQGFANLGTISKLKTFAAVNKLFQELYDNEIKYIEQIYEGTGLVEDVKKFLNYNFNKAFQNLGFEAKFSDKQTDVNPAILAGLSGDQNHDFFSGGGSSYEMAVVEQTTDDDWNF